MIKFRLSITKVKKWILFLFLFVSTIQAAKSQTTLAAGDIAFTGYISNAGTPYTADRFSFILLKDFSSGTSLNFTNNGWIAASSALRTNQQTITFTTTGALTAGTEILISGTTATLNGGGSAGTVTGSTGGLSLFGTGDQILAYQGTSTSPTFISGIHMNVTSGTTAAAWDGAANSASNDSALPPGLITGVNAIWIGVEGDTDSEKDNASFNCGSANISSITAARTALNNKDNWTTEVIITPLTDPSSVTVPTGCSYLTASSTTITSLNRVGSTPTNANTVQYTAVFGASITGLSTSNFSLTTTGVSGASIASVTGSGDTYTITVNTGTGSGNITLNLANATGISPGISTTLPFAGQTYAIDKTAPTLSAVTIASNNTNTARAKQGDVITLSITSSETITTPTVTIAGASATVTGSGISWSATLTVGAGTTEGVAAINISFADAVGNAGTSVTATTNSSTVTVDRTAPTLTVVTIASNNANTARAKQGDVITVSITSSETITTPTVTIAGTAATVTGSGTSWSATLTVGAGTTEGIAAINIAFTDAVGNAGTAVTATTNSSTVTVDRTVPTVSSINRQTPSGATTNGASVVYRVTFSESVSGVDVTDFNLTTTSSAAGTIASVSASSGTSIDVTVNTITGDGTLRLDLKSTGTGIIDATSNAIATGYTSGQTYTIDRVAPTLTAVTIASNNTNTTRAKQGDVITLSITSSETITTPTVTIAGTAATVTGSGTSWSATLTVGAGTTEGIAAINIAFTDAAGNAGTAVTATTNSSAVTVDRTAPTLSTVTIASNNTNTARAKQGDVITLSITSSEAITTPTVTIAGALATVTGSGTSWSATLTVGAGTTEGVAAINIGFSDITGNAGTAVTATTNSSTVTVDRTAPTLSTVTIASNNTNTARAKQGDVITVSITSSEVITTPTVTIAGATATVTGSGTSWSATLTVGAGTTEGIAAINIAFTDAAGNAGTAVTTTTNSSSVTVDRTAPTVSSINRQTPSGATTNGTSVVYRVTFSESVSGVDVTDFSITATGTAAGTIASVSTSSGTTIDVTVNTITGDGTLRLDLKSSGTGIIDVASNAIAAGYTSGQMYTIDQTAPTLTAVTIASNNTNTARAKQGDVITVSITSSETITTPTVTIAGATATVTGSGTSWSATLTVGAGTTEGVAATNVAFSDITGNAGTAVTTTTNSSAVTVDRTAPTVSSINRQTPSGATTNGTSVVYRVTFSESVSGVDITDFSLTATGTAAGTIASVNASNGTTIDVTVNTITGDGTLRLDVKSSGTGIVDATSNAITSGYTSGQTYTIDRVIPTLTAVTIASNNTNTARAKQGDVITLSITTSETITTPTVTIAGTAATVTGSGTSWSATLTVGAGTTEGIAAINIAFTDAAGNAGTAVTATTNSNAVTVDRTAPTLSTVTIASNNTNTARAKQGDIITVDITSSEAIATPTVTIAGTAATVTGSGTSWSATLTIGAGTTEGIAAINIAFTDAAGNAGTAVTATTNSSAVTVDRTAPTLTAITIASSNANTARAKQGDVITVSITSSETITTTTVTIAGTAATVTGSGTSWSATLTVGAGTTEGVAAINIAYADITGNTGTAVTTTTNSSSVTVDRTAPTLSTVTIASNNTNTARAKQGDVITLSITSSEAITTPTVTIAGASVTVTGSGTSWTATLTVGAGTTEGVAAINITFTDAAGNAGTAVTATTNSSTVTVDRTAPTLTAVTIVSNNANTARAKQGDIITLSITSSETITTPTVTLAGTAATVTGSGTSWSATLTVGVGTTEGIAAINIAFSDITSNAGAAIIATTNSSSVTIDRTVPTLSIVTIASNNANTARAKQGDVITLSITSSETITTPTVTIAGAAATVTGSGTNWSATLTVGAGTTEGVAAINITFADAVGNTGTAVTATTNSSAVTVDRTAPIVASVAVPNNTTYISGENLNFTVNFNEAVLVTGTPSIAITLNTGGSVNANYISGSGTTALLYRYTVVAGNADTDGVSVGSLTLNGGTIKDITGNDAIVTLNSIGSTTAVLVDAIAPTVTSVTVPANSIKTTGDQLNFVVNMSENTTVNTVGGTPSITITIGATVRTAIYQAGSGTNALTFRYTVQLGETDVDGISVGTAIALNGGILRDGIGNNAVLTLNNVGSTTAVLVDALAPTVSSINRQTPSGATTNAASVVYRVTFSESVSGVDITDFSVTATGTAAGTIASVSVSSGATIDVTVNTITGDGTLRLDVKSSGTGIIDVASNAIAAGYTSGQTYTIDRVAPTLTAVTIASNNANTARAKQGDVITLSITSSETITTSTVTIAGAAATVTGSGTSWAATLTVGAGRTEGVAAINIAFTDASGNAGTAVTATTNSSTVTVDRTAPTLSTVTIASNNTNTARAKQGDVITLNFTSSETVTITPVVTIAGTSVTVTNNSGNNWTATLTVGAGTTEGIAAINITYADITGNAGTAVTSTTNNSNVIIDRTAPTLSSVAIASNNANTSRAKQGDVITLSITSSETITTPTVTIAGTAATVTGSGTSWTATLTVGAGTTEGIAAINIGFSDITGNAGTAVTSTTNSSTVTVDRTAPTLSTVTIASNNANTARAKQGDVITLSITSSEAITTPTVTIAGASATVTGSGTGWTATLTVGSVTTEGIAAINIGFSDITGNTGTAVTATTNSSAVTVDRTAPRVISINRQTPTTQLTTSSTLVYRVIVSEPVIGITTNSFTLTTTGGVSGTIASINVVNATTYDVTVNNVTIGGSIGLDVKATGNGITDISGNAIVGGFTAGETYISNAVPVFTTAANAANIVLCQNSLAYSINSLLQVTDADNGQTVSWTIRTNASNGTLGGFPVSSTSNGGTLTPTGLSYTPNSSFSGTDVFTIEVSDGFAVATQTINVIVNALPVVPSITGLTSVCINNTTQLSNTNTSGVWNSSNTSVATISGTGLVRGVAAGNTIISNTVTNASGCTNSVNTLFTVNTLPVVTAISNLSEVSRGKDVQLSATSSAAASNYLWTPAQDISSPTSATTSARVTQNTTYTVTVTTVAGCIGSASVTVTAKEDLFVESMDVFTPNGDGINDRFVIKNLDQYPNNKLQVFDRTGKIIFEQNNYTNNWDGTVNGKQLTKDTYFYILTIKGQVVKKGAITVVR